MKLQRCFSLFAVGALQAACGPDDAPGTPGVGGGALTADESSRIHGALLSRVDATGSEVYGCAPEGAAASGERRELVLGGGLATRRAA
ncbi:MAG: hypothetical protein H6730_16870 [Deltaproteobacteria bacterium]|nr:hypothetical protein [Deltaproteobacteria bacterium]